MASTFKIVTAVAVGRLVTDGVLCWDVPIHDYLPGLRRRDEFGLKATLRDLLSNRTGLPMASFYWGQQNGEQLLDKSQFLNIVDSLPAVKPLGRAFFYSQWNYCLIQLIIEQMAGESFGSYVRKTIFDPLGLKTPTFETPAGTNIMKPHGTRSDGSSWSITTSSFDSSIGLAAGSGGKTSLGDQLAPYIALLDAYRHQTVNCVDTTPNSPFTQLRTIFSPHISLAGSSLEKQAYRLGLYRTQLPGNLSCASLNAALPREGLPVIGSYGGGKTAEEIFHHAANFPGSPGAMFLVPRTHSGVVVMSNATPLMDAPDFIGQILLSILLDTKPPQNLLSVARMLAKVQLSWFEQLRSVLDGFRTDTPPTHPLRAYAGTYFNAIGNFKIVVSPQQAGLRLSIQGLPITTYDLKPYDGDSFFWAADRDHEVVDRGMWFHPFPQFHVVRFQVEGEKVHRLSWQHDRHMEAEVFAKGSNEGRTKL